MKAFRRIGLFSVLVASLSRSGFAQSATVAATISTYAGPPLPVNGTQATSQAVGSPSSVVPDGAGGFYFTRVTQNRLYRVSADGKLTVIAGTGAKGFSGDGGPTAAALLNFDPLNFPPTLPWMRRGTSSSP